MNKIKDLSKTNFTIIPNILDEMQLSPRAFRLYFHIKRRAGDEGVCWESTLTMAEACCMSAGSISTAKEELKNAGLIEIESKKNDQYQYHEITIVDIWGANIDQYKEGGRSNIEQGRSNIERDRSNIERINIPINNIPINNNQPSDFPEVPEGYDPLNDPLPESQEPKTPYDLLADWWEARFGMMRSVDSDALLEMAKDGATPEMMDEAAKVLVQPKYRIISAYSFKSTVTNIINKQKLEEAVKPIPTIDQYHPSRIIT